MQMNLEEIMLSKISQLQIDKYCMIPIYVKYLKLSNSKKQSVETWLPNSAGSLK